MAMHKRSVKRVKRTDAFSDGATRKRSRHLENVTTVDVNDTDFLQKMMTEQGKILPARLTGATAKQQRAIRRGVRRARTVGLLM